MDSPKLKRAIAFWMNFHSMVSKAFLQSSCRRIPGISGSFVCSKISLIDQIFWPICLPFSNPDWSEQTRSGRTLSILLSVTLDTILNLTRITSWILPGPLLPWQTTFTLACVGVVLHSS